jgi:hypothetical protein
MELLVADVLEQYGWPLGRDGRTTCPLHQGKNQSSFSYKGQLWTCFACGESGNAYQLRKELMPEIARPTREIKGFGLPIYHKDSDPTPRVPPPSQRLRQGVEDRREKRIEKVVDRHRYGCDLIRAGRIIYPMNQEVAEDTVWMGLEIIEAAQRELDGAPLAM